MDDITVATKVTVGYTWGQNHSVSISGTLLAIGFGNYNVYSFTEGKATLTDGSVVSVNTNTKNLKNVVKLDFRIASNNSVNGAGIASIFYLPK